MLFEHQIGTPKFDHFLNAKRMVNTIQWVVNEYIKIG